VLTRLVLVAASPARADGPPTATVAHPLEKDYQDQADFTGRIEAAATVELRPRVTGYIVKILFKEGDLVKKDDLLFQIDERPYRALLERAEAEVARAEALLKGAEAAFQRTADLAKKGAVAKEDVEKMENERAVAKANREVARAERAIHRLNLEFTRVTAPIDGRIGRIPIDPGNLVVADAPNSLLATIVSVGSPRVAFDLDEVTFLRLRGERKSREIKEVRAPVAFRLVGEKDFTHTSTIDFIDPRVDGGTGTIRARAAVADPDGDLRPGMFVGVRVTLGEPRKILLVPDEAVAFERDGKSVLVVNDQDEIERRNVKLGPILAGMRGIESGLKKDEWVVIGPRALKVGAKVAPQRKEMPERPATEPTDGAAAPAPPEFPGAGPAVVVTASYPGANARTVRDSVATPIEQQLDKLEGLVQVFSACSTGELRMTLLFKEDVNLDRARFLAQDRVALALPAIPAEVQNQGVSVTKRGSLTLSVAVFSPDGSHDQEALARFTEQLRTDLARTPTVAEVGWLSPTPGPQARIDLDRARLAAVGLAAADVDAALRAEERFGPWMRPLKSAEDLGNVVIKGDQAGRVIRLRDVAKLETVRGWPVLCDLNGRPCLVLRVDRSWGTKPAELRKEVEARLAKLAKEFPAGLTYRVFAAQQE
jgi:RND family efflux transporter MFP subunit